MANATSSAANSSQPKVAALRENKSDRQPTPYEAPRNPDRPAAEPDAVDRSSSRPEKPPHRRRWVRWFLFALLPLVLVGGGYWYVTGGQIVTMDDAYVEAQKVGVSSDVPGIVKQVDVTENEKVAAGEVLYRLDPRQYEIALASAKANLSQTGLTIDAMKDDYTRMLKDAAVEQAQVNLDQINYQRDAVLVRSASVAKATFDQAAYTLEMDKEKLASLKQQAAEQLARLGGNASIPTSKHPQYLQAQAQVAEAQRQLNDTIVRAPFAGVVTGVPSIAPGKYLASSTTAFTSSTPTMSGWTHSRRRLS